MHKGCTSVGTDARICSTVRARVKHVIDRGGGAQSTRQGEGIEKKISSPRRTVITVTTGVQSPFETISLDLITDLPTSRGYDSILTVVDHGCSKAAMRRCGHKGGHISRG